jgi:RNA polymerase sigma factor (sigma-70 family)
MAVASHESTQAPQEAARFPPTLWSVVLRAGGAPSEQSERALATLCQTYWSPIYAFLRRRGCNPHDAQDLTQSFFLSLIEQHKLGHVRPERGRFRSFLRVSLNNFLSDERSKQQAKKRGGGISFVSLNTADAESRYAIELSDRFDPERIYERRWATTLMERVLTRLEAEWKAASKQERFSELRVYLTGDPDADSYSDMALRLGMTPGAVKVAVLRLRHRYRELFREIVAETLLDPEEIEDEIRHLLSVLGQ